MLPIMSFGFFSLPSYGLMITLGIIIGICIAVHYSRLYDIPVYDFLLGTFLAAAGLFFGAKLLYMITVLPNIFAYRDYFSEHIKDALIYMFGGYVFYGGLTGALLFYYLFCNYMEYSFLKFTNIIVPVIPLIHSFGRIGCFLGGCCYGIPYHGYFSVTFPEHSDLIDLHVTARFPVQILEACCNLILACVLLFIGRKPRKDGFFLGVYFICYGILRFSLEFLRGDVERGILLGISTSQWISLVLIPIGVFILKNKSFKNT